MSIDMTPPPQPTDLYLISCRFSILFIDLIGVHEVLPDNVGRGSYGGDGVEERLGHPDSEDGIFLSERLAASGGVAEPSPDTPPDDELNKADRQSDKSEPQFHRPRNIAQVDDESRGASDRDDQRRQPHVERNLPVRPHPTGQPGHDKAARLRHDERQNQQRRDARKNLNERTDARTGERKHCRRNDRNDHIAHQTERRDRRHVGPQHASNDHSGHSDGSQHADHRPLRHRCIERQQSEINRGARNDLKQQQPRMKHGEPHFADFDAAKRNEKHQEDKRRRNHPPRPLFQRRNGTAQQRADNHSRRHGNAFQIAMKVFKHVHIINS